MKRVMFLLLIMACSLLSFGQSSYTVSGNTYKVTGSSRASSWTETPYLFEQNGQTYPILINQSNGHCKVIKTSQKTGKQYPFYFTSNEKYVEIEREIAKKMGVQYIEKTTTSK